MNQHYETVIIGGGPAGLCAAYFLAKAGRQACVLEQKKEIGRPVCCGEAISAKSLEMSGLYDDSYIDSKVRGFRIFFPNDKFFSVESHGYLLNRDKFEKFLAAQAEKLGAKIMLLTKASGMESEPGRNRIKTPTGDIAADFIIGADGPDSFVERTFFSNRYHALDAVQFKISKNGFPYPRGGWLDFYYDALSPYYFWVFEKHGEFNIGGLVKDKAALAEFINKRFPLAKIGNSPFSRGKIPVSWIKQRIQENRVFLTGDAAGLTNPVTFAGIYSAIASGRTAAESVVNFKADPPGSYNKRLKQAVYLDNSIKNISTHCYSFHPDVLNFIGEYFEGRDYRTKDYLKFLRLSLKTLRIFSSIFPLLNHRQLLKNHRDDIW